MILVGLIPLFNSHHQDHPSVKTGLKGLPIPRGFLFPIHLPEFFCWFDPIKSPWNYIKSHEITMQSPYNHHEITMKVPWNQQTELWTPHAASHLGLEQSGFASKPRICVWVDTCLHVHEENTYITSLYIYIHKKTYIIYSINHTYIYIYIYIYSVLSYFIYINSQYYIHIHIT